MFRLAFIMNILSSESFFLLHRIGPLGAMSVCLSVCLSGCLRHRIQFSLHGPLGHSLTVTMSVCLFVCLFVCTIKCSFILDLFLSAGLAMVTPPIFLPSTPHFFSPLPQIFFWTHKEKNFFWTADLFLMYSSPQITYINP